ncbi:MAG: hypothetical protein K6B28_07030, partial [Lachnospiraceae bacterium]|nr:hypothetical protein [Lachnospiraceae bacterium]
MDNYIYTICNDAQEAIYTEYDKADGDNCGHLTIDFPCHDIKTYCRENDVSEKVLLHSAFSYVLNTIFREEILLYVTADERAYSGYYPMLACYTGNVPVKDHINGVKSRLELLTENNQSLLKKSMEKAGISGDISFSFYSDPHIPGRLTNYCNDLKMNVSINIVSCIKKDSIIFSCVYDGIKYGHVTIEKLLYAFKNAVLTMTSAEKLSEVSLVSEEEKKELIELSAGEKYDYDRNEIWLDLFKKNVTLYGDKNAVTDSNGSYTYKELDEG